MKCVVCLMQEVVPTGAASYVVNGYSVCGRTEHIEAVSEARTLADLEL